MNKFQRKMFRLIVGWARHDGEDWSDTMSRMNRRIVFAMSIRECKPWFSQIFKKQFPSQPKYSIRVILGPQQPASGIQPVSGSKTCPLNPNVGKVVHQNNGMTILKKKCDPLFSGVVGHGCSGPAKIAIPIILVRSSSDGGGRIKHFLNPHLPRIAIVFGICWLFFWWVII